MIEAIGTSMFFGAALTLFAFELAVYINHKFPCMLTTPVLSSAFFIIIVVLAFDMSYDEYNSSAKYVSYLATPATVALAVPLYRRIEELKANIVAIFGSIFVGVFCNLTLIFIMCKFLELNHVSYASLIPKGITTSIALAICDEYGGISSITILGTFITGVGGNILGSNLIKIFGIKNAVSKGLALGAGSHALGTVRAVELGETEGAISGLSIAITGIVTVLLAPVFINLL